MFSAASPVYLELASSWVTGIPAFIFASGFVMGLSSKGPGRDWRKFLIRRAQSILPAYVFFTVVYYLYFKAADKPPLEWPLRIAVNVLRGDSAAHMWFVVAIFQMYMLLPVFERVLDVARSKRKVPHFLAAAALIQLAWTLGFPPLLTALSGGVLDEPTARQVSWRFFPYSLFMFVAGLAASKDRDRFVSLLRRAPLHVLLPAHLALGLAHLFVPWGGLGAEVAPAARFILRLTALGIYFQWSLWLAARPASIPARLIGTYGQYAYGIYLAHVLVEDLLLAAAREAGAGLEVVAPWFGMVFAANACLSLALVWALSRLPGSAYLIGQTEGRDVRKR